MNNEITKEVLECMERMYKRMNFQWDCGEVTSEETIDLGRWPEESLESLLGYARPLEPGQEVRKP